MRASYPPLRTYKPVWRCIYCGDAKHSTGRPLGLGREHIIPEGLNGDLILPKASCSSCAAKINRAEQFCQKEMLGPLRYQLKMKSKRPKLRPTTLSVPFLVGGIWEERNVNVADYPVRLLVPVLPEPEIMVSTPVNRKTNLIRFHDYAMYTQAHANYLLKSSNATQLRVTSGKTDIRRFAIMLAKIGHAYATAELGPDGFHSLFGKALIGKSKLPKLHYVIGGSQDIPSPDTSLHTLDLHEQDFHGYMFWVVTIRLFAKLGWPRYHCIVGVDQSAAEARLVRKMCPILDHDPRNYANFETPRNPALKSGDKVDYLCAQCNDIVAAGLTMTSGIAIRCAVCKTWNALPADDRPWHLRQMPTQERPGDVFVHPAPPQSSQT